MFNQIAKLVSVAETVDAYGDIQTVETEKTVFCEEKSVGMSEKYQAQSLGLKPEIKLVLADYLDYSGEELVRYQSFGQTSEKTYQVLRTYRDKNNLELVLQSEVNNYVSPTVSS